MKKTNLIIAFIFWLVITLFLCLSVIGILILIPKENNTDYYKSQEELRCTWMRIGYGLYEKLVED